MTAYKIFEVGFDPDGTAYPKTLFHGMEQVVRERRFPNAFGNVGLIERKYGRRRRLPLNTWIQAEQRMVTDGSRQQPYRSGFHCYQSMADVTAWLRRAQHLDNRVVVRIDVNDVRSKPRAVRPTWLAGAMRISQEDWNMRILAADLL